LLQKNNNWVSKQDNFVFFDFKNPFFNLISKSFQPFAQSSSNSFFKIRNFSIKKTQEFVKRMSFQNPLLLSSTLVLWKLLRCRTKLLLGFIREFATLLASPSWSLEVHNSVPK
jgi:hypothetical protein